MQSNINYFKFSSFNKESTFIVSIYVLTYVVFILSKCSDAYGDCKVGRIVQNFVRIAEYVGTCHSTLSI